MLSLIVIMMFTISLAIGSTGGYVLVKDHRLRRPTTDRLLIREANRALYEKEKLAARYPNSTIRPAVGDFGESCLEVDINNWAYVRSLEFGIYRCYWHTTTGEYLPAGITPEEEAMDAAKVDVAVAIREDRERQPDLTSQPSWWMQRLAEMTPYEIQELNPADVERTRAAWRELVAVAERESPAPPPYPWGESVTKVLREADVMLPPIERMTAWDYNQNKGYWCLTVHYSGGTVYRAIRNQGRWNVTVGQVS